MTILIEAQLIPCKGNNTFYGLSPSQKCQIQNKLISAKH